MEQSPGSARGASPLAGAAVPPLPIGRQPVPFAEEPGSRSTSQRSLYGSGRASRRKKTVLSSKEAVGITDGLKQIYFSKVRRGGGVLVSDSDCVEWSMSENPEDSFT